MPTIHTPALVIRRADYSDYDRMVTLFSPEYGRIDAIARGCRKPKSPLVNAVEPFTSGEFQLYTHKDRFTMEQCQITESFFDLRSDYDRLCHGVYWLKLLDISIMPDTPAPELFMTTLRALAHLNYGEMPLEMITMAYEMHFMALNGYAPRMDACVRCGKPLNGDARFDPGLGGAVCLNCPSTAQFISNGARRIMMKLPRTRFDQFRLLDGHPDWEEAAHAFRRFILRKMPVEKFAPPLP
ncbi:MAG: DNA repair protein RecO [Clostridiales bacterium]|nr:DNA repair protein RecO [Clostridiales bacterium]